MADVHFRCLGCNQPLVADEIGAGVSFSCPHCKTAQLIPVAVSATENLLSEEPPPAPASRVQSAQPAADGGLWVAQERLWQNEHQSAEQAIALVERDQRISALRAECDWLTSQLDEERNRRQALEPELDLARGGWAATEKRANDLENNYNHTANCLRETQIAAVDLTHQLELVKTERSDAVLELARQHETLAELNLELNKARGERAETEAILGRARLDLDRTAAELATAESVAEQSAAEVGRLKAAAAHLRAELGLAAAERDKFQALIREDKDLSDYVDVKADRDRFETELKEIQARLAGLREKIEELTAEREALKHERTELQLRVAALRDAHDDSQLQQDNEVLRRMVERLNEQLKQAQPDSSKRKRRDIPGGVVGGLARAVASRVFVPDPEA